MNRRMVHQSLHLSEKPIYIYQCLLWVRQVSQFVIRIEKSLYTCALSMYHLHSLVQPVGSVVVWVFQNIARQCYHGSDGVSHLMGHDAQQPVVVLLFVFYIKKTVSVLCNEPAWVIAISSNTSCCSCFGTSIDSSNGRISAIFQKRLYSVGCYC